MKVPLFELMDLCFAYPGRDLLLKDISLSICRSEFTLLKGENGSGKSTFLRLLMGLLEPVSGCVTLEGKNITESDSAVFKNIVYLQQRAQDNLFGLIQRHDLELWRMALPQQFSDQAISSLQDIVKAKLDVPYKRLSGGELRAVSLLWLPLLLDRFWILDEPTAGLDSDRKEQFNQLLLRKRESGNGALIVSHDPVLYEELFDRVFCLEQGRLNQVK